MPTITTEQEIDAASSTIHHFPHPSAELQYPSENPTYPEAISSGASNSDDRLTLNRGTPESIREDIEKSACVSCGGVAPTARKQNDELLSRKGSEGDIVDWDGPNDPEKPINWPVHKKLTVIILTSLLTLMMSFGSSVFTPAVFVTAKEFEVSSEVMLLGLSLYILGYAFGPMFWGPASEVYGRTTPFWIGMFAFCVFQIPVGVAQNVQTVLTSRFLQGAFGTAPMAIVGGMYFDFLEPIALGMAASLFMSMVFVGPTAGPILGSLLVNSHLGWRWTSWITLIFTSVFLILAIHLVPETSAPIILRRRAQKLRLETKNFALHAKCEESPVRVGVFVHKYLTKPAIMLVKEPILLFLTLYMSLVYGILFLSLPAYFISFQEQRGWSQNIASLSFIGLLIGILIASAMFAYFTRTWYAKRLAKRGKTLPEDRLPLMIVGSVILPVGLFWFAWTSQPSTSWVPQCIASVFIGCGIILIFLTGQIYQIDVYLVHANSALAVNAFFRSLFGAAFPLFAPYMYHNLGVDWATSILGFACVVLMPFPFLFWKYGQKIRSWSKFAFIPQ